MLKKLMFLAGLLVSTSPSAVQPDETDFRVNWNRFAGPMNEYLQAREGGVLRVDKLKEAVHAWRKLARDQDWDRIP